MILLILACMDLGMAGMTLGIGIAAISQKCQGHDPGPTIGGVIRIKGC
jgi:hypothetical protein